MRVALNKLGEKVHISNTHVKEDYFCPICCEQLVLKKGDVRIHHFAHKVSTACKDGWHYDMSEWHVDWQNKFPKENQEIVKTLNVIKHRADVLI